jgi:hypothetical protein
MGVRLSARSLNILWYTIKEFILFLSLEIGHNFYIEVIKFENKFFLI